ncbi:glycoside hydrolase family 15 protein [Amycolatopsis vancoresmycina]|uniref:Glucan 1,4-alpha-glucosidase n=1 Tax=Amycolatopsis vancoresmycina DSM 44592 TaxID=1292037 RepID=R1FJG1_9PSEU|nr:glycoside hydrolase family 15 protein [Amycolatopsis vancoresmycina]EOD59697.1 glucan 1,4-alpha-glucosidase [Amycolatopsis vancoresmycina DSM 44592]
MIRWKAVLACAGAGILLAGALPGTALASGTATDCCGGGASWATGNKSALGTSTTTGSPVWFTVANGVTSEVFYPRADVPNMQDMQFVITDGSSFVDLERDATNHVVSMPDEKALQYTVTNTAKSGKYRITTDYVTDPARATLVTNTRFQSLDGGSYRLYLLANPSMAGGGSNDNAWWDSSGALMASGTETLFGGTATTVVSALRVSTGFTAHDNGYTGAASDCLVDLRADKTLNNQFDAISGTGNVVQCGQIPVGTDTTFTVALGYGGTAAAASSAASASLTSGFPAVSASYRSGWNSYVTGLKAAPASVSGDTQRRRAYYVAAMALKTAEDKQHPGASVAGLATPWGDFTNGDHLNDGYHRVWGRDLYQQATGLLAAGDSAQAKRMAQFLWNSQWIGSPTAGDGTTYPAGSFPRYSPVSGVAGASAQQLGCCEQLDQDADAILLAWLTGLTDASTYAKVKTTAGHIVSAGPDTTERWEEQYGKSPSSVAAEIAGLVAAGAIARANGDTASASAWESTADSWRNSLAGWTVTTSGYWGGHTYYERLDRAGNPNDGATICFDEGCFYEHDVTDFGFLDLVRLGIRPAGDTTIANSVAPTAAASDGNSAVQVTLPNGDVYFHRYPHDNYGESTANCSGWPANGSQRFGRLWPVLSGERGEYELANGRSAAVYLKSMADSVNDGYFVPEQVWDRADVGCFGLGRPTGSAGPLMWAEGQYLRLAQSIDAGRNLDTPSIVKTRYGT